MAETVKIYLSGGMGSISFEESNGWRTRVKNAITCGEYDLTKNPSFFNPNNYFNFVETRHESEREVMDFDLYNLRDSNLVIVNFNDEKSIGTAMEIAVANELKIPCIGLNIDDKELHPWLDCMCTRVFKNMREMVNYVVEFYLQ